jgi:hypothetical protein
MVKRQYRAAGIASWQAMAGNALLAVVNKSTSDRRLIINSLELYNVSIPIAAGLVNIVIGRSTTGGGTAISLTKMDSNASLPSGIEVRVGSGSTISGIIKSTTWYKNFSQGGQPIPQRWGSGVAYTQYVDQSFKDTSVEAIVLRNGESMAVTVGAGTTSTNLFRVSGKLVVAGSPNRTYLFSQDIDSMGIGCDLISIVNGSVSSVVHVKNLNIQEIGTFDTPYLQVVPIGAVSADDLADTTKYVNMMAMDSNYGAFDTTKCLILNNCSLSPYGVPFSYLSEASTLTPKGYNYLHTKDFIGPSFFTCFTEFSTYSSATAVDTRLSNTYNHGMTIITPRDPIVVRPGEGIAVVSAAETAAVTTAIGTAAWMAIDFGITVSTKPLYDPVVAITGLLSGSDIVILTAGTTTELLNVDSHGSTSYSWSYDPDVIAAIDICIYKAGYIPYIIRNYSPGSSGGSVIVSQTADRAYIP